MKATMVLMKGKQGGQSERRCNLMMGAEFKVMSFWAEGCEPRNASSL